MRIVNNTAIVLAIALAATPAFAQSTAATSSTHNGATSMNGVSPTGMNGVGGGATAAVGGSTNPVLTHGTDVRASKVIGSSVYNDQNVKVGSVDDIVIGTNSKPSEAIISVGGFLGMGSKLVAVPYDKLQFGDTQQSSDNRVKLPGATKQSLTSMSAYNYSNKG